MGLPPVTNPSGGHEPSKTQHAEPFVGFSLKDVPPANPVYLQLNDSLMFFTWTNSPPVFFTAKYRFLKPDGNIVEGAVPFIPTSTINSFSLNLGEGWLLSLGLFMTGVNPVGTLLYVQVCFSRGF